MDICGVQSNFERLNVILLTYVRVFHRSKVSDTVFASLMFVNVGYTERCYLNTEIQTSLVTDIRISLSASCGEESNSNTKLRNVMWLYILSVSVSHCCLFLSYFKFK